MKLKDKILVTLLLTMGLVLHYISPGIFFGMKMDFLLVSVVISIVLFPSFDNYVLVAFLSGVFSALTTTLPGGQIPNLIDKFISSFIIYLFVKYLISRKENTFTVGLVGLVGTFISGSIFLLSAKYIMGMKDISNTLIYAVVLPTAIINSLLVGFVYKVLDKAMKNYKLA